jgi:hypothetical protein
LPHLRSKNACLYKWEPIFVLQRPRRS